MSGEGKKFIVTKEAGAFLLGRLGDEKISGAYLSPEYLTRLIQVLSAAKLRADVTQTPDAIRNLFGILENLVDTYASQSLAEYQISNQVDYEKMVAEMRQLMDDLGGNDDGPKHA